MMSEDPFAGVPAEGQAQVDPLTGDPIAEPPPEGEGLGGYNPSEQPASDERALEDPEPQEVSPEVETAPAEPEPEPETPAEEPKIEHATPTPAEEPKIEHATPTPGPEAPAEAKGSKGKRGGRKSKAQSEKAPTVRGYVLLKKVGDDKYQRLAVDGSDVIVARSGEYAMRQYAAEVGEIDEELTAIPLSVFATQRVKTTTEQKVAVKIG